MDHLVFPAVSNTTAWFLGAMYCVAYSKPALTPGVECEDSVLLAHFPLDI